MFRRFMIVCWTVFAALVLVASVGWIMYTVNDNRLLSLRTDEMIADNLDSAREIEKRLRQMAALHRSKGKLIDADGNIFDVFDDLDEGDISTITDDSDGKKFKIGHTDFEIEDFESPQEHYQASDDLDRKADSANRIYDRIDTAKLIGLSAGILAGLLLIWNVIWHISHWVWEGRKVT